MFINKVIFIRLCVPPFHKHRGAKNASLLSLLTSFLHTKRATDRI